jgi:hypothetical protein
MEGAVDGILRVLALSVIAASAALVAGGTASAQPASFDRQPPNSGTLKQCARYKFVKTVENGHIVIRRVCGPGYYTQP